MTILFHVEQQNNYTFDIIVVGGGHAGLEAAFISHKLGMRVALVTMPGPLIGSMPCNPSIGGVGKGQVVREIDCLGGLMPLLADKSAIQYRILNETKGFAVKSTRAQVDKDLYAEFAEEAISACENITVIREEVASISKSENRFFCNTKVGSELSSAKIIVTAGTFLGGKIHRGSVAYEGGRYNADKGESLDNLFDGIKSLSVKFKTGTPPRLNADSIDYSKLIEQKSDPRADNFHYGIARRKREQKQVSCYIAHTNDSTMNSVRNNKEKSPMFNGQITAVGARYCPSLEDKAFRYPDKNRHHVFIEPESLTSKSIYPNGISSSLPAGVQEEFVRTIEGLEKAEILVHGYAVEYDVVDTSTLNLSLESKDVPGAYFAGQLNGTSGYEEAAGQGLIAGINASFSILGKGPFVLDRAKSYIGVMVEDLVSNERDEPYRLFTARNENRLYVREDNTINRLAEDRAKLELKEQIDRYQERYLEEYDLLQKLCDQYIYQSSEHRDRYLENDYGPLENNLPIKELLKRSQLDPTEVLAKELEYFGIRLMPEVIYSMAVAIKYEGYIKRVEGQNKRFLKLERKSIDWKRISENRNVSFECRERIRKVQPESFGHLSRIKGIRPATLAYVAAEVL